MSQKSNTVLPIESEVLVDNDSFDTEETNAESLNWVNTNYDEFASVDTTSVSRKTRRRTNKQEQTVLESSFKVNQRPDIAAREKLAKDLGMSTRAIQIWFQNKRQTLKKKKAEPLIVPVESDQEEESEDKGPGFTILKISDCRVAKRPPLSWQSGSKKSSQLNPDNDASLLYKKKDWAHPNQEVDLQEYKRRKSFSLNISSQHAKCHTSVAPEAVSYEAEDGRGSNDQRRLSDLSDCSNPLPLTPETPNSTFMDRTIPLSKNAFVFSPPFPATTTTSTLTTVEPSHSTSSQSAISWSPVFSQSYTPLSSYTHSPQSVQLPPITPIQGPGISPLPYQQSLHMNPSSMDPLILPPPLIPEEIPSIKGSDNHSRYPSLPSLRSLPENNDLSLSPLVLKDPTSPMVYFPGSSSRATTSQGQISPFILSDPMQPLGSKLSSMDQAQKEKIRPRV